MVFLVTEKLQNSLVEILNTLQVNEMAGTGKRFLHGTREYGWKVNGRFQAVPVCRTRL